MKSFIKNLLFGLLFAISLGSISCSPEGSGVLGKDQNIKEGNGESFSGEDYSVSKTQDIIDGLKETLTVIAAEKNYCQCRHEYCDALNAKWLNEGKPTSAQKSCQHLAKQITRKLLYVFSWLSAKDDFDFSNSYPLAEAQDGNKEEVNAAAYPGEKTKLHKPTVLILGHDELAEIITHEMIHLVPIKAGATSLPLKKLSPESLYGYLGDWGSVEGYANVRDLINDFSQWLVSEAKRHEISLNARD